MNDERFPGPQHTDLSEDEARKQRGGDPPDVVGHTPKRPDYPDPDPEFVPDPDHAREWHRQADEIGKEHRPRREDVYPYLLVRAFSPGDRGQRPLWPPTACWESPDLLLIDSAYSGPFDPVRLVVSPMASHTYRVFVRVWNLGLFPALGVHIRAWAIPAGFFGVGNENDPYYQQHHIGGAWVDLSDRRSAQCVSVVELDAPWRIDQSQTGHECLIASVSCPADHFTGPLLVNTHRHVGQRNLTILGATEDAEKLVATLAALVPRGFTLEVTHGGPAVLPLLRALAGGRLRNDRDEQYGPVLAPDLNDIRAGVNIGTSVHLMTAFEVEGRTVLARSSAIQKVIGRTRFGRRQIGGAPARQAGHLFADAGGTRRFLNLIGPERWREVGEISDQPMREALGGAIARLLGAPDLRAQSLGRALGGPPNTQHLLRFTLSTADGDLVGGYSIVVSTP